MVLDLLVSLVPVLSPILIAILVGFVWAKKGTPAEPAHLTQVILNVGTPCLVFSTLSTLTVSPLELGTMALACVLMLTTFIGTSYLMLRGVGLPHRIYLAPTIFGNLGNLGLPVSLYAFGDTGLELALIMFATQSVLFFTINMWLMSGKASPVSMLKTPHIYAIAAALAFTLTDTAPPAWVSNTTELLGGMTIPLMLIMLGISLARMKVVAVTRPLIVVELRLLVGVGVALGVSWLLGLDGIAAGVIFIACCMPAAVFNYLMAVRFDRDPGEVASFIVLNTLAILVLLPLLVPVAWWIAGIS